jgi:hypothetical protein
MLLIALPLFTGKRIRTLLSPQTASVQKPIIQPQPIQPETISPHITEKPTPTPEPAPPKQQPKPKPSSSPTPTKPDTPEQGTAVMNPDCDQDQPRSKFSQMPRQFSALVAFDCARKLKDLIGDCGLEKAQLRQKFDEREKNQPDQLQQIEGGYQNQVSMIEKNCVRLYSTKYKDNAIIVRDFIVNQQLRTGGMGDGSEYVSVSTLEQLKNVVLNLEALGRYVLEGHP